ncbi:MAG: RodZ domain-containing protein [Pseudomonadota bacterium]
MTDIVEEHASAPSWEGAGASLKRERENQGLSTFDVARALRLSEKQIVALEMDDYAKLPGRTFVRGFIRNYARLMQLDPEPLMAHISIGQVEESHQIQVPSQKISFSEHQDKPWLKWLMMAFVIVAVISWSVLEWLGPEQPKSVALSRTTVPVAPLPQIVSAPPVFAPPRMPEKTAETLPSTPVVAAEPAIQAGSATVPATALARLSMTFSGRAWVEVRDKSGKIIHSQNNSSGADQVVEGEAPLSLVIGSAPNVKLMYKGQLVDLSPFTKADVARLTLE